MHLSGTGKGENRLGEQMAGGAALPRAPQLNVRRLSLCRELSLAVDRAEEKAQPWRILARKVLKLVMTLWGDGRASGGLVFPILSSLVHSWRIHH